MTVRTEIWSDDWYEYLYPLEPDDCLTGTPFVPPEPSSSPAEELGNDISLRSSDRQLVPYSASAARDAARSGSGNNLAVSLAQELAKQKSAAGLPANGQPKAPVRPAPAKPTKAVPAAAMQPVRATKAETKAQRRQQHRAGTHNFGEPLYLANVSTNAVIDACATRLRARAATEQLEAQNNPLRFVAGLPALSYAAHFPPLQTPSRSATPGPTTSTAAKGKVKLEAPFSPIVNRDAAMSVSYLSNTGSENDRDYIDHSRGRPSRCSPIARPKAARTVTFAESVNFNRGNDESARWSFYPLPPDQPAPQGAAVPPFFSTHQPPPVMASAGARDDLGVPREWNAYASLMAQSFYIQNPPDVFLSFLDYTLRKITEKPDLERLMCLSADMVRRSAEFHQTLCNYYISATMSNSQIMLNESTDRTRSRWLDIAQRRLRATTQQAAEQASLAQRFKRENYDASAPEYSSNTTFHSCTSTPASGFRFQVNDCAF